MQIYMTGLLDLLVMDICMYISKKALMVIELFSIFNRTERSYS